MTPAEKAAALEQLAAKIKGCQKCQLHEQRTQAVPGEGDPNTKVMLIGEGPGKNEDRQGRPFVGAAGKFLAHMLESIGWRREDVFIANVVKCRPPDNRDPEPNEAEACWPYLAEQIRIIAPQLIVILGRHSLARFLPGLRIGAAHGQPVRGADGQAYLPLYHPAAALYSPSQRETHLRDFQKIPTILKKISEIPTVETAEAPAKNRLG